jgi:parallel beta-helix repeat protein
MPSIVRTLAAIFSAGLATPLWGQGAPTSILRSDQNTLHEFAILNDHPGPRDFVLKAVENTGDSWAVIYLADGLENITSGILSPAGVTLRVAPGAGGLTIQAAFFGAGTPEHSIRTTTLTATPVDGNSLPQSRTFRVRMLSFLIVNDDRDLGDPDPLDEWLDADPATPGEQITLRAALELANRREGLDTIGFNMPVGENPRITLQSPLPEATGSILIDGTTQPGPGSFAVEISGKNLPEGNSSDGLVLSGGGSTLRGLSFTRFRSAAFGGIPGPAAPNPSGILLKGGGGNRIEDCYLGLAPVGETGAGNEGYGIRIECPGNVISNCHIAGNWVGGIGVFGPEATGNTISTTVGGSFPGTHSSNLLGPGIAFGDLLLSPSPRTSMPSFAALDSNLANSSIHFTSLNETSPWESIAAGFLGGIVLHQAPGNTITECRVQGNGADGIRVIGDASGTTLRNNITGDRLAPFSLRNAGNGIALECDHAILEGNETHCNLRSGVLVRGIGNELKGLRSSGNGECGVHCEGRQTLIGGSLFADRGQIYSNPTGILLTSPPVPVSYIPGSNRVHGNLIGAQAPFGPEAPVPHPNLRGIHILDSSGNRVGGSPRSVEANSIVHNHLEGILVSGGGNNRLHGNFIADNGRLDIDLSTGPEGDGRDPPDPDDLDEGGNHKINPPVLQRVVQDGNTVQFAGQLPGASAGTYQLEIVISMPTTTVFGSQYSEIIPLNHTSPVIPFTFNLRSAIDLRGSHIRASITDTSLNTSEYSEWIRIEGSTDTDGDGISDSVEEGLATGDANEDGVPDARQGHVASFPVLLSGSLTIATPEGFAMRNVSAESLLALPPLTGQEFPHEIWYFELDGLPNGGFVTMAVLASSEQLGDGFHGFGPTPDNPVPHWYDFSFDGTTGAQIDGDRVLLHFVDGRRGDHDLTVNGILTSRGGSTNALPPLPDPSFHVLPDGSVAISWPLLPEAGQFFLQESPRPDQFPWTFSPAPVLEAAGFNVVRVIPVGDRRLFRLVRP